MRLLDFCLISKNGKLEHLSSAPALCSVFEKENVWLGVLVAKVKSLSFYLLETVKLFLYDPSIIYLMRVEADSLKHIL